MHTKENWFLVFCLTVYTVRLYREVMVEYLNKSLLQIYHRVCQRKNFENRLTFRKVMGKSLVSCILTHGRTLLPLTVDLLRTLANAVVNTVLSDAS